MKLLRKSEIAQKRQDVTSERYLKDAQRVQLSKKIVDKLNQLSTQLENKKRTHQEEMEKLDIDYLQRKNELDNELGTQRQEALSIIESAEIKEKQNKEKEKELVSRETEVNSQAKIVDETLALLLTETDRYEAIKSEAEEEHKILIEKKDEVYREIAELEIEKDKYEKTQARHRKEQKIRDLEHENILRQIQDQRAYNESVLETIKEKTKELDEERQTFLKLKARYARR